MAADLVLDDVDWYLDRLDGVEGGQGQWGAWCPCHDDVGTEWKGLSITEKRGKILIKCHSCGAQLPEVYEALSGEEAHSNGAVVVNIQRNGDGPEEAGRGMEWWEGHTGVEQSIWEAIGCYGTDAGVRFTFAHDETVFKLRRPPKDISWAGTDAASAPPLWPMPMDTVPEHCSITEGESDCGTAHAAGLPYAFAVTKGSKGKLPIGWAQALKDRGCRRLLVCGDTDDDGQQFIARVSREAVAAGLSVEIVRLETILDPFSGINDLNGVWQACETVEEFREQIERATQQVAERMTFHSVEVMEEEAKREIDWLIPDLIAPGDKVILTAPQKSLKSWMALELTRALATQQTFLMRAEWQPVRACKVGFIQEEGSPALWARRIAMLDITGNKNAGFAHRTGFRFTEPSYTDEVISSARDQELDMLIFDPLQRMTVGIDENSAAEVAVVWDEVFRIQQALPHLVVMIVHHANRSGAMSWEAIRGSSRHGGEVDLGMFIEKHPMESNKLRMWLDGRDIPEYLGTGEVFEIRYHLDRDAREFTMDGREMAARVTLPGEVKGKENRDKVIEAISGGDDTRKKIMLTTGLSDTTVRDHVDRLVEDGTVTVTEQGPGKANTYALREDS